MLYCTKCHGVCQDSTAKCPNCKNTKLRPLVEEDLVFLQRADQYTASLMKQRFTEEGVHFQMEPYNGGRISYMYEGDVMPTDQSVLARWADYDAAKQIAAQVVLQVEKERASVGEDTETFQDMPKGKRIAVQVISVFAFILVIMLVVFGTDAFSSWLKGLFS